MESKKTCTKCGVEKPLSDFYWHRQNKRHRPDCKLCVRTRLKRYKRKNPEAYAAGIRRWRDEHPERVRSYSKTWSAKHPDKRREAQRRQQLAPYGLTIEQYDEILEAQGHACAICERHESEFDRRLAVDHCHETGAVRALLCGNCNKGLGCFQDDPELLMKAADYRLRLATGVG